MALSDQRKAAKSFARLWKDLALADTDGKLLRPNDWEVLAEIRANLMARILSGERSQKALKSPPRKRKRS